MQAGPAVARRHPARLAVEEDGGRSLTYAELEARSSRLAHYLAGVAGLKAGDRVGYLLYNRLEVVELLVACAKLGAIAAPMNFRLTETDLRATGSGSTSPPASLFATAGSDDALIQYTSGTTGLPKGATFTHDAVLMHAANVALEYAIDASSRVLISIPHNSATNIQTIPALYTGATLVLGDVRSFDGEAWLERVNRLGVTHSQVVPTMLYRVLEVARRSGQAMPAMRRLGYGSAPIPPDRVKELAEVFGNIFIQLYGMIEVAAIGTMLRPEDHARALPGQPGLLASIGQPSYGIDVRVKGPAGELLDVSGRGEVVFKGPYVMRGYWNEPELTAAAIQDGWMHSGDVAELRDGWFYLVDRIKDIIIRGGQNIASKEVEEALYQHPAVMEAAVIGVPSAEWGEDIVAVVVLRPGERATAEQLRAAALASGLTRFKCPVRIDFGPTAPQREGAAPGGLPDVIEPIIAGEEILNLNVWTTGPDGSRPVLVWIHGGGFFAGCSANPWYDGASFARHGLVVVSINYRLGAEGFAALGDAPSNRGLLDCTAALEWVRDNIAAFGGDPGRVTVMGQSAGGMAVACLLVSAAAAGLFGQAVIASGIAPASAWPAGQAQVMTQALARHAGVEATRAGLASRIRLELIDAHDAVVAEYEAAGTPLMPPWGPVIDGDVVAGQFLDAVRAGRARPSRS